MNRRTSVEGGERPYSANPGDFVDIDDGIRWDCIKCGKCCGNVFSQTWLDAALKDQIGDPMDDYCRHLDRKDNLCHIHHSRPNICRGYPFILRKDRDHYKLQVHSKCPGLGQGPLVDLRSKVMEIVKLAEDDFGCDFIVDLGGDDIKLFRVS
jgi:Fe-S-cluster containining protein